MPGASSGYQTTEAGHGRREERCASVLPAAALGRAHAFPGLAAIGRIAARRTLGNGRQESATRYVVLSRRLTPHKLLQVVRAHWSIDRSGVIDHERDLLKLTLAELDAEIARCKMRQRFATSARNRKLLASRIHWLERVRTRHPETISN